MPLVDVRLLVTALLIQRDSGGNLAEILDEFSRVIQRTLPHLSRSQSENGPRQIDGRDPDRDASYHAGCMGALNPGYIRVLFVDPTGRTMLLVAAGMQIFGSLLLWKIVNIEV